MSLNNTVTRNGNIAFITGLTAALADPIVISLLRDILHRGLVTEMSFNKGISAILADNAAMRTEILQLRFDLIEKNNFNEKILSKEKFENQIDFHESRIHRPPDNIDMDNNNMNLPSHREIKREYIEHTSEETSPNSIEHSESSIAPIDVTSILENHQDLIQSSASESTSKKIYHRPYDLPPYQRSDSINDTFIPIQTKKKRRMSKYFMNLPQNLVLSKEEKSNTPEPQTFIFSHGYNMIIIYIYII